MYQLKRIQTLPIRLDQAWDFFSSPGNLRVITPDDLDFRIQGDLPERMYPGVFIQYQVRPLLGIPVRWVTEITHARPPEYFVDEQRLGPYRIWHHQHFFEAVEGGVKMTDIVDYQLPFGPLGRLLHAGLIRARLESIFDYRYQKLEALFGRPKEVPVLS